MIKIGLLVLLTSILSACSGSSDSKSGPGNNKPVSAKHIEPGVDLTFLCNDTFHQTLVSIKAVWDNAADSWKVSVGEIERSGNAGTIENLVGKPDEIQVWKMNIRDATGLFAVISQNGRDQAIFQGRGRKLDCTFN